jgi:hypothetical protein
MSKRVYSEIPKFKKVEATMRQAVNGFRPALLEIERALKRPRSPEERALLKSIRDQTLKAQDNLRQVIHRLYVEVDG